MSSRSALFIAAIFISIFIARPSIALSPPWWGTQRLYANSFGASPCITVQDLEEKSSKKYILRIDACQDAVAEALATILKRKWSFGRVKVYVRVYGPEGAQARPLPLGAGSYEELKALLEKAMLDNPYFVAVREVENPMTHEAVLFVECTKEVIQFWNDNLGDLYGNENYVAAAVFSGVTSRVFPGHRMFSGYTTAVAE